ncbi:hypothetical protein [Mycetocola zhadangensis]|uniref:Uncharacterized protein n=1 Tax=Mycetocola zhadangensis TaxID=1164595 RepID=A0A3L7J129_9MICO|nr:hypothetical protein [Mycetocola zhadangensis]RLQ84177.1 hypothetical protein D9V28_08095 [Mycetocola zhadangensis]GGE95433.1 hypothetical protein GCM10011313_18040 [Mycetocola zhadangensis]
MESIYEAGPVDRDDARSQLELLAADRAVSSSRAAAPWWLIALHGLSVAGFVFSFGLGRWEAAGFAISALVFVGLGMIRPWITRTRAEPWSTSTRAVRPGVLQFVSAVAIIAVGALLFKQLDAEWVLWPTAILACGTTVWFGLQMERALALDVAEGV